MMIRTGAAAERFKVDAEGARAANEADNVLTVEARASRARMKLLDKIEGIVRESVKPMEKIDGINILHVDGINGGDGGSRKNVTDEVIDSALRYRVQAPMIDSLMKEVGIEGGSIGRMTDVLRDAKDLDSIVRNRKKDRRGLPNGGSGSNGRDDRDRTTIGIGRAGSTWSSEHRIPRMHETVRKPVGARGCIVGAPSPRLADVAAARMTAQRADADTAEERL